jgi:hypothetical protein
MWLLVEKDSFWSDFSSLSAASEWVPSAQPPLLTGHLALLENFIRLGTAIASPSFTAALLVV